MIFMIACYLTREELTRRVVHVFSLERNTQRNGRISDISSPKIKSQIRKPESPLGREVSVLGSGIKKCQFFFYK